MILLAEALALEPASDGKGNLLYSARLLEQTSPKYQALEPLLTGKVISRFLVLHERLTAYLDTDAPLVIVTDWSDPCEVVGLRLETPEGSREFPGLCFLALYTDWEDLVHSGIEEIFAHELSHVWLHWMGYRDSGSRSNRFHTCTAITDPYLAFSEGFAEHFEILSGRKPEEELYDHGFGLNTWLCYRDEALRQHAVKNNRFLYLTAEPPMTEGLDYAQLHMLHNTSSAFLPELLKNGRQAVSSEGLIASFFYRMVTDERIRSAAAPDGFYSRFGAGSDSLSGEDRVYLRILYAISRMDFAREVLFTDFVSGYCACFPAEREAVIDIFGTVTNFVTVRREAQKLFGEFYICGRLGVPGAFKQQLSWVRAFQDACRRDLLSGAAALDGAVAPGIWVTADREITPVPWDPGRREALTVDLNAATAVDFLAFRDLDPESARALVRLRDDRGGFADRGEFDRAAGQVCSRK